MSKPIDISRFALGTIDAIELVTKTKHISTIKYNNGDIRLGFTKEAFNKDGSVRGEKSYYYDVISRTIYMERWSEYKNIDGDPYKCRINKDIMDRINGYASCSSITEGTGGLKKKRNI